MATTGAAGGGAADELSLPDGNKVLGKFVGIVKLPKGVVMGPTDPGAPKSSRIK